jgi:preprotein translocase subunit YajC
VHPATLATAGQSSTGSTLSSLIIFLLIPVGMYFLLIRPQRKRQREQVSMQRSIEVGDEIMTTSGLYGFVTELDGDIVWLEIDDDVQIRIARAAVQRKVDTSRGETAVPVDDGSGRSTPIEAPKPAEGD